MKGSKVLCFKSGWKRTAGAFSAGVRLRKAKPRATPAAQGLLGVVAGVVATLLVQKVCTPCSMSRLPSRLCC